VTSFVDSKKKELSQEEIIKIAAKETGGKYTAKQVKAALTVEAYQLGALMIRQGNTIFVVHQDKSNPTVALFRALNADTIPNYINNSFEFVKAVGAAGFQYIVAEFDNKSLLAIFERVYRKKPFERMGYAIQQSSKTGRYRVTVNLGQTPKTKQSELHKQQLAQEAIKP
jgi:hypothetical protein